MVETPTISLLSTGPLNLIEDRVGPGEHKSVRLTEAEPSALRSIITDGCRKKVDGKQAALTDPKNQSVTGIPKVSTSKGAELPKKPCPKRPKSEVEGKSTGKPLDKESERVKGRTLGRKVELSPT